MIQSGSPLGFLMALAGRRRWLTASACALTVLATALAVTPFFLLAYMVGVVLDDGPAQRLVVAAVALGGSLVLRPLVAGAATWLAHVAAFDVLLGLRGQLLDKLLAMPPDAVERRAGGSLKRLINDDVESLEQFLSHQLPDMLGAILVPVATVVVLAWADWRLALAALAVVPLILAANSLMMRGHGELMGRYFGQLHAISASTVDYLQGAEVVQSHPGGHALFERFRAQVDGFRDFAMGWQRVWAGPWAAYTVFTSAANLFVLPLALVLYGRGSLSLPTLVFAVFAAAAIGSTLVKLVLYGEIFMKVSKAAEHVQALLAEPQMPVGCQPLPAGGDLRLEGVSVRGDGQRIRLGPLDLDVPGGATVAIVGASGSGKSTLARLLARQFDPDAGVIRLGGADLATLEAGALSAAVALIDQRAFLIDASVLDNLRLARPDADAASIHAVLRAAGLEYVVESLPEGLDTPVGEGGLRLSGGQRQRLALARALLCEARVLILDEATSFLDPFHEAAIQRTVNALADGLRTLVVVSHRLESVTACDRIVLLQEGRVVAQGRHEDLLNRSPAYRRLWAVQQANLDWRLTPAAQPTPAEAKQA